MCRPAPSTPSRSKRDYNDSVEYVVVIERGTDGSFSAYVPDLPGCVACGDTADEVRAEIREAVLMHVESLRTHGEPVPPPSTMTDKVRAA